jgi:hypothetical protein
MFQNVLMDLKISKEKQTSLFQCLLKSLCPFKKNWNLCVFPISYTCKHVLFRLNTLRLFQDINKGTNMSMQKVNT